MKVALFAEEAAGLRALRAILAGGDELVAVVTSSAPGGPSSSIERLARSSGCEVWQPEATRRNDFADKLRALHVDMILNVHSLHILDGSIVAAPRIGSFNLHPGPLPQFAGLNAPSWAVFMGEKEHAVTLHWMEPGIDTGPIAYVARFEISDRDTGLSVSNACVKLGVPLLEQLCEAARLNVSSIPKIRQDSSLRRFFGRSDVPNQGRVDWSAPAREIDAFVRATDYGPLRSPWGRPKTFVGEADLGIVKMRLTDEVTGAIPGLVLRSEGDNVAVAAGDRVVVLQRIEEHGSILPPGKRLRQGDILR